MNRFRTLVLLAAVLLPLALGTRAPADSGVLVPWGWDSSESSADLRLASMDVDVRILGSFATVRIRQIHESRTRRVLEGRYVFVLPERAAISDFVVWDDGVRIPGVILERGRAEQLYREIRSRRIDPGLMEVEDPDRSLNEFSARVVPIPPFGTKRLELEYTQELETVGGKTRLTLPLAPNRYHKQRADSFALNLRFEQVGDFDEIRIDRPGWPFIRTDKDEGARVYSYYGEKVELSRDVSVTFRRGGEGIDLDFKTYRAPLTDRDRQKRSIHGFSDKSDDGFFNADLYFNLDSSVSDGAAADTHPFFLLLDTSYSMRGMKLERAWEGLNLILEGLPDGTPFNVATFATRFQALSEDYAPLDDRLRAEALAFVSGTPLIGGTDLSQALPRALKLAGLPGGTPRLLVITDGRGSYGEVRHGKLQSVYRESFLENPVRPLVLAVGNDADLAFLGDLVDRTDGFLTWLADAGDTALACAGLLTAAGSEAISGILLGFDDRAEVKDVYPKTPQRALDGGHARFVGRYARPVDSIPLTVGAALPCNGDSTQFTVDLPNQDTRYPEVRRRWARARVDYLLDLINREGETDEWIDEIVALSKEFNFVTPYTAFLAAPRSLIRPRSIRPGDPVLRVKTDPGIVRVTAFFPFGLIRELDWLETEGIWETRFLAPAGMHDGEYFCTLALRDVAGNAYHEKKSFLIDSRPPRLIPAPINGPAAAGEEIVLRVSADRDTRWIRASLDGLPFVELKWSDEEKTNTGRLRIPPGTTPGLHEIRLTARDFAHNNTALTIGLIVGGGR